MRLDAKIEEEFSEDKRKNNEEPWARIDESIDSNENVCMSAPNTLVMKRRTFSMKKHKKVFDIF